MGYNFVSGCVAGAIATVETGPGMIGGCLGGGVVKVGVNAGVTLGGAILSAGATYAWETLNANVEYSNKEKARCACSTRLTPAESSKTSCRTSR